MLLDIYRSAADKSITLTVIASLKDPAIFLRDFEQLFAQKTREVVIMGGVHIPEASPAPRSGVLVAGSGGGR